MGRGGHVLIPPHHQFAIDLSSRVQLDLDSLVVTAALRFHLVDVVMVGLSMVELDVFALFV